MQAGNETRYAELEAKYGSYSWFGLAEEVDRLNTVVRNLNERNLEHIRALDNNQIELERVEDWTNDLVREFADLKNNLEKLRRASVEEVPFAIGLVETSIEKIMASAEMG